MPTARNKFSPNDLRLTLKKPKMKKSLCKQKYSPKKPKKKGNHTCLQLKASSQWNKCIKKRQKENINLKFLS